MQRILITASNPIWELIRLLKVSQSLNVYDGFADLSRKISSERPFKSLSLRGVVMAVVSRESLNLGQEIVLFMKSGHWYDRVNQLAFGRMVK